MVTVDKIRRARSVQDLERLIQAVSISTDKTVSRLNKLLRASKRAISMSAKSEEIQISHTGTGLKPSTKVRITGQPAIAAPNKLIVFNPPKVGAVTEHTDIIDAFYANVNELVAIEGFLLNTFNGFKGQQEALKGVRTLKDSLDDAIYKAFDSLHKITKAHLPAEIKALGDSISKYLIDSLDKDAYDDMSSAVYLRRTKDKKWYYSFYVTIDNLKNESDFTFEDYNVVLSALVSDDKEAEYYITTLADFRLPGKFPLGRRIESSKDIEKVLSVMLRHNDVVNVLAKKPLGLQDSNAFKKIANIKDAIVEDDTLVLKLSKRTLSTEEINTIVKSVLPLLNTLLANKTRKNVVTWKQVPKIKPTELHFILVSSLKDSSSGINTDKLRELKHALDLTDEEVDAIKSALLHHSR